MPLTHHHSRTTTHCPGVRLYHSAASVWMSVDPLAEKYPGMSPYTYCAGNPVVLKDPDGREIWIVGEDCNRYRYYQGYLYTEDGNLYTPESGSFLSDAAYALDVLKETKTGKKLVETFECTDKDVVIQNSEKSYCDNLSVDTQTDSFIEQTINWNHYGTDLSTTAGSEKNAITDLGHELSHVWDNVCEIPHLFDSRYQGLTKSEWRATYKENLIRKELGNPLRTEYNFVEINKGNPIHRQTNILKKGNPFLPNEIMFEVHP